MFFSGPSDFILAEKENGNNGKYMNRAAQKNVTAYFHVRNRQI